MANYPKTFASITLPPVVSRPNDLGGVDRALDSVRSVFGHDAVLVPVSANTAAQMSVACSEEITIEKTRQITHQARLTREAIAAACGVDGLFAVFFPTPAAQLEFLADNPRLRGSLITGGPLGSVLWLRCTGQAPATTSVAGASCWLGAGTAVVVAGRGALQPAFTVLNLGQPVEVQFDEIAWAEPMRVEFVLREVAATQGGPWSKDPRGRLIPHWDYWARCFARIGFLHYDVDRKLFFQQLPGQDGEPLPGERIFSRIADFLTDYGRQERFAILLKFRQSRFIKECMAVLKNVAERSLRLEDPLEKFLSASLEVCPGANVSSAELNARHSEYCHSTNEPPFPKPVFEKRVPAYIERMFRGLPSRKLIRNGKYCRGFRHVRLQQSKS